MDNTLDSVAVPDVNRVAHVASGQVGCVADGRGGSAQTVPKTPAA